MKKILLFLLPLFVLAAGCTRELETRMNQAEERLAALETQVARLNEQLSVLQKLVSGKYFIQSVTTLSDGSGYKLVLVDGNGNQLEKTILHGTDGTTPEVGIRQFSDGNYYWTLNGDWLLVGGEKVRANGEDAPEAQFKVENGRWYMRVGTGAWTYVGEAVTEVRGPISSVDAVSRADVVLFTLSDGTVLEVPKASAVKLQLILDDSIFQTMTGGESRSTAYTVKVPAGVTYTLDSYEPEGWKVQFTEPEDNSGILTIALPASASNGKVMLVVNGSDGSCYVRVLHVGDPGSGTVIEVTEVVDAAPGTLDLPVGATAVLVPVSVSWIQVSGTRLLISENSDYDARTAVVTYKIGSQHYSLTVVQVQKDAIVLAQSTLSAKPEGEELAFVLKANVEVEAEADVSWISVSPATKGLVDKPFTIVVKANDTSSARMGTLTFSSGELSQTLTITQAGGSGNPLLAFTIPGIYLGMTQRVYIASRDQYLRSYDGDALDFVLLNKAAREQVKVSGYTSSLKPGDPLTLSIDWEKAGNTVLSQSYPCSVLHQEQDKVWLGNENGEGVIIRR